MSAKVADVIIIIDNKVLLVQQRKKSAFGLWSYPGGLVEEGETNEQALVREVKEELGTHLYDYTLLNTYDITNDRGNLKIYSYLGKITGDLIIKEDELIAYKWFSLEELVNIEGSLRGEIVLEQAKDALKSVRENLHE